jgi:hypothetical protein
VAETFYVVQDPALFNTSYSDALLVRAAYDHRQLGVVARSRAVCAS